MKTRFYTESHEWLSYADGLLTIGLTDYAREQLGDVVFVELPDLDAEVGVGDELVVIESVKAAGDISSPFAGVIREINESFVDEPEQVNDADETDRWFVRLALAAEPDLSEFMDSEAYLERIGD